jgi:NAD(P)-dependent dehydrogenase (short-subunit alcohol dehydrogenase family)
MNGTIIIVGGAGGVGAALARKLAASGRKLHLVGRDKARLEAVAGPLDATVAVADALDKAALTAAVQQAGAEIAGLAYAVGTINLRPLAKLTDADFENDFRLNALGAVHAVQAALPGLKAGDGTSSILLFSTVAVSQGFSAHASIAMAKGAVEGLTVSLGAELAPKIRVNCIAPSLTRTPLAESLTRTESMATAIAQMHAMHRLGEPDDVAALGAFLMSPDAGWITGQIIGVDGGRSMLRTKG